MKNIRLLRRFVLYLLFAAGTLIPGRSSGQSPITISGPTTACVGDVPTYTFSPVSSTLIYTWTVTSQGNVLNPGAGSALIQWVATGNATITVKGKDTSGTVIAQGTLPVTVSTPPNPVITASTTVDCQPLDTPKKSGEAPPFPGDSSHCVNVCAYSTVTYTVPAVSGATYTWSVNGDVSHSSSGNSCTVNWGSAGAGNVSVTVTKGSCSGDATMCINIIEGPQAHFVTMPNTPSPHHIEICLNSTVIFIDQSTSPAGSPIVSWLWDFGDGSTSSAGPGTIGGPIQHTYTQPGTFKATLVVTNACGCTSAYSIDVVVSKAPGVTIECPRVSCEKEELRYYIEKPPCDKGKWEAIGGHILSQNPQEATVIWDNTDPSGFGYLSYTTDCGECPGTTVIKVPVIQQNGTIQGPTSVCPNTQYIYSLPQWPTTQFTWTVTGNATMQGTDQPNEIAVTTGNSGSFSIRVSYCNTLISCTGSAGLTGTIMPAAAINGPTVACINQQQHYSISGASTATWTLTPPTGSPIVYSNVGSIDPTFTQSGSYTLSVSGNFCPPEPIKIKVSPKPPTPTQILGPDKACKDEQVQYTAQAPISGTTFEWFAAPGTVNSGAGSSTYAKFSNLPAHIKVVRITTDAAHCVSDTLSKLVSPEMPTINMSTNSPATVCGSTQWHFFVNYADADLYEWKVIDQSMGSVVSGGSTESVQVLFNNPVGASQNVKVVVAVTKCSEVQHDTITIHVINVPDFTVTPGDTTVCAEENIQFTITPTPTGYSSLSWNFGDANSSTAPNPTHSYSSTGAVAIYHPVVNIVHPSGCLTTATLTAGPISVKPTPVTHVSPANIVDCGSFTANLTAAVTTGFGSTTNFKWFGTSSGAPDCDTCAHWSNISQYGAYYVIVSNSNGCSDTSNIVNVIENCPPPGCPGPAPKLLSSDSTFMSCATARANVHYDHNSTSTVSETWLIPVGATGVSTTLGTSATATASFAIAGVYNFTYLVTYNNGTVTCTVGFPQSVYVPFVGDMLYDVSCGTGNNYIVTLHDHSNIFPGETMVHQYAYKLTSSPTWLPITPQPGEMSAIVNLPAGSYDLREVIHSISTPLAPACTTIHTVVLPAKPVASFNPTSVILPPNIPCERDVVINFNNTSTPSSGLSYEWTFGDISNTNYLPNPSRVYLNNGSWVATLTAANSIGCSSSVGHTVQISNDPYWDGTSKGNITANPNTPQCPGNPVTLTYHAPTGYSLPPAFIWYKGNAPISGATSSSTYAVTQPGGYRVIGSNANGCIVPSKYIPVDYNQVPPAIISGKPTQCAGVPFTLNGFAGNVPGLTYQWQRSPGGNVGTTPSITQTLPIGTYTYTLTLTLNGCHSVSVPFTVTVTGLPAPPSVSYTITNCNPYTVQLNASNAQTGTYNWSNGATGSPAYANAGGYYQVTFTNQNGCVSHNSLYAKKSPQEYLWIFPTGCFCLKDIRGPHCGQDNPFITGPIISFAHWAYLYNGGVDASGSGYVPDYYNFLTLGDGTYNLLLDNGYCHVTSDDMYLGGDYCKHIGEKPAGLDDLEGDASPMLKLVPNPATGQTEAEYRFADKGNQRSIEVYDMLGRKMNAYKLNSRQGSLTLPLSGYAAGMYQVYLREDGRIIAKSKLSVTH